MAINKSEIAHMSREEKMEMIELLWADLSRSESDLASPEWHEAALQHTDAQLAAGQETLVDWDDAKRDLRKRFD